jgi:Xaa-Pro aminopeptidase
MARAVDPDAKPSAIADASLKMYGDRDRGQSEPDPKSSIAATLKEHKLGRGTIGCDDLRTGFTLRDRHGLGKIEIKDALDLMVRARVVKTAPELEAFRRIGKLADRIMEYAGHRLEPGLVWNDYMSDVAQYMVSIDVAPVDDDAMLFGGAFAGEFIPELFRTRHDGVLERGQIVIIETLGSAERFWIDINRTATLGPPSREYQRLHDIVRDTFLYMIERMKSGANTGDVQRGGFEYLRDRGVPAPEKLIAVAHGVGHMPVEMPQPYPYMGVAGSRGFELEENMVISLDCLYFGASLGPCHMENVFIIGKDGAESTYQTPLELLGPR